MRENHAEFKHVSREIFNKVADRVEADTELYSHVTIEYRGTNLYGDMVIEGHGGYSKEYKKALVIFNEEYCK